MAESPHIVEVNEQNFMQVVVEGSLTQPVLVDFWADWCEPCKQVMPALEKLADEGQGAFVLAKCNADENQNICAQIGIRSLPTGLLFSQGQPVDQFMGAQPEGELRAMLERHISFPPAAERPVTEQADALLAAGDVEGAVALLRAAQAEDPENGDILVALGQASMVAGDSETVETILAHLPESHKDKPEVARLRGLMSFANADNPELNFGDLGAAVEADTATSEQRYQYAVKLMTRERFQDAMDQFLALMLRDRDYADDAARKALIAAFDVLGQDPLVSTYRRKLASYVL
ncbi:MAG: tetratricopeptide repeat protein [Pseudomonadota bacterium]